MRRTAYWLTCDNCMASMIVYPHPDAQKDIPDKSEWEWWSTCVVCDESVEIEGTDPAHDLIPNYPKETP